MIGKLFTSRQKATDLYATQAEAIQERVFQKLIQTAAPTEWGKKYDYARIRNYTDFQRVPVQTYEEIKGYVDRMRHGEADVLWPGKVRWYAKSSGTTNDKSKFIPVSKDGLHGIHYKGGTDAVALYLRENPESRFFSGKGLILGGSHQLQCQGQSGGRPFCHPDPEHQSAGELHPRTEQGNRTSVRI